MSDEEDVHHGPMMSAEQDPQKNDYATPPEIWRPLAECVGGFDTDPCSGAEPTPIAPKRYTKEENGLEQAWEGDVFVNPPWSSNGQDGPDNPKKRWYGKCIEESGRNEVTSVVALAPSDTSPEWFQKHIMSAEVVCFYGTGRVSFIGENRNPSFGLIIAVYGENAGAYKDVLDGFGTVIEGRSVYQQSSQTALFGPESEHGGDGHD